MKGCHEVAGVVWEGLASIGWGGARLLPIVCCRSTSCTKAPQKRSGSVFPSPQWTFLCHSMLHADILPPFQRVRLYNAFATSLMCRAGLEVLDVYSFTRSYPGGTGGPEVAHYKEHDTVHFKYLAMKPLDLFLEDYFLGKVPFPIDLQNYQFSWLHGPYHFLLQTEKR